MPFEIIIEARGPDIKLFKTFFQTIKKVETNEISEIVILRSQDAANVIPVDKHLNIIMINQFRFGIQSNTIEIPGGFIEENELSLDAIKRELREETGYHSENWKYLGSLPSNPVFQDSRIHHFLATEVSLDHLPSYDPAEHIEIIKIPLNEALSAAKKGKFEHPHTLSAFLLAYDDLLQML